MDEKRSVGKFWESFENFWWKFYRKIKLFLFFNFFENLLLKIEHSEIPPFFYNNSFGFGGGWGFPPFPPGYALGSKQNQQFKNRKRFFHPNAQKINACFLKFCEKSAKIMHSSQFLKKSFENFLKPFCTLRFSSKRAKIDPMPF